MRLTISISIWGIEFGLHFACTLLFLSHWAGKLQLAWLTFAVIVGRTVSLSVSTVSVQSNSSQCRSVSIITECWHWGNWTKIYCSASRGCCGPNLVQHMWWGVLTQSVLTFKPGFLLNTRPQRIFIQCSAMGRHKSIAEFSCYWEMFVSYN